MSETLLTYQIQLPTSTHFFACSKEAEAMAAKRGVGVSKRYFRPSQDGKIGKLSEARIATFEEIEAFIDRLPDTQGFHAYCNFH